MSRLAAEMAAEIRQHDWSDAPYRADRAGHERVTDSPSKRSSNVLSPREVEILRINVMWVTGQVLGHADPNFEIVEFAASCGVTETVGWLESGVRTTNGRYDPPGTGSRANEVLPRCHACLVLVERVEGQVRSKWIRDATTDSIVWGPVWVHEECQAVVSTPYDNRIGSRYLAQSDMQSI